MTTLGYPMNCKHCGANCPTTTTKSIDGSKTPVCDACYSWKGTKPPALSDAPLRKGLLR